MEKTITVGVDLGDKRSEVCVLDDEGVVATRKSIATTKRGFAGLFSTLKRARVILEVGTHSRWTSSLLRALGHEVITANPRQVRLIASSHKKTDRFDAELLARLGRVDVTLLSPVTQRGDEAHFDLAVVQSRDALVSTRTKLINRCRGLAKAAGYRLSSCSTTSFHTRVELPDELRPALAPLMRTIEQLTMSIKAMDKQIDQMVACCYPEAERLTAVDGVGAMTALAFVLTLEDPARFKQPRRAGAYLGLTPRLSQSGAIDPQLGITKAGNGYVRKLLVQCAQRILGPFGKDTDLRRWGLKIAERGGKNAKRRAVVAVARKLAVLLCKLWTSGEDYVPIGYHQRRIASA